MLVQATFVQYIGATCVQHIWVDLDSIHVCKYAQHNNAMRYNFRENVRGKPSRKLLSRTCIENSALVLGWVNVPKQGMDGYVAYQTVHTELEKFFELHQDAIIAHKKEKYEIPVINYQLP